MLVFILDPAEEEHLLSRLSTYPGVGHMPFWEATERFDRELAAFAGALAAA